MAINLRFPNLQHYGLSGQPRTRAYHPGGFGGTPINPALNPKLFPSAPVPTNLPEDLGGDPSYLDFPVEYPSYTDAEGGDGGDGGGVSIPSEVPPQDPKTPQLTVPEREGHYGDFGELGDLGLGSMTDRIGHYGDFGELGDLGLGSVSAFDIPQTNPTPVYGNPEAVAAAAKRYGPFEDFMPELGPGPAVGTPPTMLGEAQGIAGPTAVGTPPSGPLGEAQGIAGPTAVGTPPTLLGEAQGIPGRIQREDWESGTSPIGLGKSGATKESFTPFTDTPPNTSWNAPDTNRYRTPVAGSFEWNLGNEFDLSRPLNAIGTGLSALGATPLGVLGSLGLKTGKAAWKTWGLGGTKGEGGLYETSKSIQDVIGTPESRGFSPLSAAPTTLSTPDDGSRIGTIGPTGQFKPETISTGGPDYSEPGTISTAGASGYPTDVDAKREDVFSHAPVTQALSRRQQQQAIAPNWNWDQYPEGPSGTFGRGDYDTDVTAGRDPYGEAEAYGGYTGGDVGADQGIWG